MLKSKSSAFGGGQAVKPIPPSPFPCFASLAKTMKRAAPQYKSKPIVLPFQQ